VVPTILRFSGLPAMIYPNDHRPAHIHVIGEGREAVFNLHCPHGPPELRENYRFSMKDITRIEAVLAANLADACREWESIHGDT
jgi:Domain of unknown function (DUF4160)